jgi:antitoxin (DNA-binding transcriptional repressor) of toxin-antitoxin stability system
MAEPAERMFPMLLPSYKLADYVEKVRAGGGIWITVSIPWAVIAPHARQAWINHSQTLERLAERGGLSAAEAVAVLDNRAFRKMEPAEAEARLAEIVREGA